MDHAAERLYTASGFAGKKRSPIQSRLRGKQNTGYSWVFAKKGSTLPSVMQRSTTREKSQKTVERVPEGSDLPEPEIIEGFLKAETIYLN